MDLTIKLPKREFFSGVHLQMLIYSYKPIAKRLNIDSIWH